MVFISDGLAELVNATPPQPQVPTYTSATSQTQYSSYTPSASTRIPPVSSSSNSAAVARPQSQPSQSPYPYAYAPVKQPFEGMGAFKVDLGATRRPANQTQRQASAAASPSTSTSAAAATTTKHKIAPQPQAKAPSWAVPPYPYALPVTTPNGKAAIPAQGYMPYYGPTHGAYYPIAPYGAATSTTSASTTAGTTSTTAQVPPHPPQHLPYHAAAQYGGPHKLSYTAAAAYGGYYHPQAAQTQSQPFLPLAPRTVAATQQRPAQTQGGASS